MPRFFAHSHYYEKRRKGEDQRERRGERNVRVSPFFKEENVTSAPTVVCQSIQSGQETEYSEDPMQPTLMVEMAPA